MDVADWLKALGLSQYSVLFRENDIDTAVLASLTADDLKELGITSVGHRRRLLEAIAKLRDAPNVTNQNQEHPELGERRQVTVLFADLAGYTKLSQERDPEEINVILSTFFELADAVITDHGGTIDKHIGDCVMGIFGAPRAHGNDTERAVRCALKIREAMPALSERLGHEIAVHIGVASGEVVASAVGSADHSAYTVTGESVNLASRLTSHARSGEVLASAAIHRILEHRLDCEAIGEIDVKGLSRPVPSWRIRGIRDAAAIDDNPFVGRQNEVGQFITAIESCLQNGRGQVVYVRGEPGIGKTRLIEEFQKHAITSGLACHKALVLDFGAGIGRDAVRSIVRSLLGVPAAVDTGDIEPSSRTAQAAIEAGLVNKDHAVFLCDLLSLPQPTNLRAMFNAMDTATRLRGATDTVAEVVARISQKQALMLIVEDMHWADSSTLESVATLAATTIDRSVVLVITSRTEGDPLTLGWRPSATLLTIELGPLRRDEAVALASGFFDITSDFASRCVERAAGNPLFLNQLLRDAEVRAETGVPDSVQSLVQARIDRLGPKDKRAIQVASVFGQRFSLAALQSLLRDSSYDARALVAHFLVRPQGEELLFEHALIRDAIYATLLRARRRELHGEAAGWFHHRDPSLHAEHLDRADDPKAPLAYLDAARAQAALYHYEQALKLAVRGSEIAVEVADKFALAACRGDLLHDLGSMSDAGAAYEEALGHARDDAERCRAWLGLAAVKRVTDQLDEAVANVMRVKEAAMRLSLTAEAARAHFLHGNLLFPRGDVQGCLREHQCSLELAREAGSAELEAAALGGLGDAEYMRGRMLTADSYFRRCIEVSRRHGFGRMEVANLPMAAFTRWFVDVRDALKDALAAIDAATKVGHHRARVVAHHSAYFCRYSLGDFSAAEVDVDASLSLARRIKSRRFEGEALAFRAEVRRRLGRRTEAFDDIGEALAIGRETGMEYLGSIFYGILALIETEPKRRSAALAEGEALLQSNSVGHNHLLFRKDAIDACFDSKDWNGAEHHAAALEEFVSAEPMPWSSFIIGRAHAIAAVGRGAHTSRLATQLKSLIDEGTRLGLLSELTQITSALDAIRFA